MRTFIAALLLLLSTALSAQVADVRLVMQTSRPTTLEPGELGNMVLAIQNLGPDAARNVRVEFRVSPGVTFTRVHPNCGAPQAGVMVCTFGDLAPAAITYGGTDYAMPFAVGTHTVTATLLADGTDPEPANNVATLTYQTVRAAGVIVSSSVNDRRIDPGQTAAVFVNIMRTTRTQETDTIPAGTIVEARLSATNGATIEGIISAPPFWSCTVDGATATCRAIAPGGDCCGILAVRVRASENRAGGPVQLRAEAVVQRPSIDLPAFGSAQVEVFRHVVVTNVADAGPGSLRAAIDEVNAQCATQSCRLLFEIPPPVPAEGAFTITPATPLPRIVADRILIDAVRSQTALTGDTNPNGPEIVLDGTAAGRGLEVHAACEGTVRGLTFRNFHANEGLWFTAGRACEGGTFLPRDWRVSRNVFESNRRGLILDGAPNPWVAENVIRNNTFSGIWMWRGSAWIDRNRIEDNGASGVFFGPEVTDTLVTSNTIRGHRDMGIAAAYGATYIVIAANRMRDNRGLGIDWGLDGVTPQRDDDSATHTNAPTILSAVYDPATNRTIVTVTLRTRRMAGFSSGSARIDLYTNDGPDADGETPIYTAPAANTVGTPFTLGVVGDHRGKWINATATREVNLSPAVGSIAPSSHDSVAWTSELSNAVLVTP